MKSPGLTLQVFLLALILTLFSACSEKELISPNQGPSLGGEIKSGSIQIGGIRGIWNSALGDCVPPMANCIDLPHSAFAGGNSDFYNAVTQNDLNTYLDSPSGNTFLESLDDIIKRDIENGRITIKKFYGNYFFVFPGANDPYFGPNYSQGGRAIQAVEIP